MSGEPAEETNEVSQAVIGEAIEVHRELGPGLLESAYHEALMMELEDRDLDIESEVDLPIRYKGDELDDRYRVDLIVEDALVVEAKAVGELASVHERKLLTYLELSPCRVGLLVNFHRPKLVDGVRRLVR